MQVSVPVLCGTDTNKKFVVHSLCSLCLQGSGATSGNLYIIGAQYKHEGRYTCQVTTTMDYVSAFAYLTVRGECLYSVLYHVVDEKYRVCYKSWKTWSRGEFFFFNPVMEFENRFLKVMEFHLYIVKSKIPVIKIALPLFFKSLTSPAL